MGLKVGMNLKPRYILTIGLASLLYLMQAAVPVHADSFTMDLTGVGDGAVANGVYVSPYQGTITDNITHNQIFNGFVICDDFNTESYLNTPWNAISTNAGSLNGNEKFQTSLTSYTVQQNYNAVAWLANQLLLSGNVTNWTAQTNYSFAIWDIMDGQTTDPDGGAQALIASAFDAVTNHGYVGSNVTVYTPNPNVNASQEFLVVNTPEPSTLLLLGAGLLCLGLAAWRKQSPQPKELVL